MATVTAPKQHGLYTGIPFSQKMPVGVSHQYSLDSEDDISPMMSPLFPPQPSPILSSGPIPNPPFVFPERPATSSAPSSFSRATGRRPKSAYELQGGVTGFGHDSQKGLGRSLPAPLPSFSFNPSGQSEIENGMASPPESPNSPSSSRPIPSRAGGHRRGGSEFIGGDGKTGAGMGLMSTSPTKGDGALPPPNASSLGPPAGRRGHAHRRSAAISCHDLTMILKPPPSNATPLGGSAPASPADNNHQEMSFPRSDTTIQTIESVPTSFTECGAVTSPPDTPPTRPIRNRVGFSDTVEFIPRPLSLVSSDASSTATMRPGHSVSNSLSSVISAGTSSPPPKDQRCLPSPSRGLEARPSTAGPIMGSSPDSIRLDTADIGPKRRNSNPPPPSESTKLVENPPAPKILPRKYFFFGHDAPSTGEASPTRTRPVSSGSSEKSRSVLNTSNPSSPRQPSDEPIASIEQEKTPSRRPSLTRKPSKKQKKVRSWAGSILSRKPRQRSQKGKALSRKSPTPPPRSFEAPAEPQPPFEAISIAFPTFDEATESPPTAQLQTDFANWKPRQVQPQDEDSMSPVIDLDAALGPFNTPLGYDADWEASQRGSGPTKRRMHSAAGMGGFMGPFHRRAESAPEMENPRFGLHHIGSRSTMEDVFEEDEEEDSWEEVKSISHKGSKNTVSDEEANCLEIDIKVVDSEGIKMENAMDWTAEPNASLCRGLKRKGSGLSEGERRQASSSSKSEDSVSLLKGDSEPDNRSVMEVADEQMVSRPESRAKSSDSSEAPLFRPQSAKDLVPVEIQQYNLQPPFLTPSSPQSTAYSPSPFPSPRSPFSYDAQRISTAPSSFTDEHNFQSLLLGEPGPELRMSVDGVPSLTSSNSTMTRESTSNPGFGNPQFRTSQRSASLSGPSATRKRSSIASLSRLLNSSHGERSKLSIEERAPTSPERKEKLGKGKRLSRMMQFWKAKDTFAS